HEYAGRCCPRKPGIQPSETAAIRHQVSHYSGIDNERRAVLRNDNQYLLKDRVKHTQSPFKKGLLPHDEIPFVFAHSQAFSPGEKDAGHLDLHLCIPSMQAAKKKEGVGHPTPSSCFRL